MFMTDCFGLALVELKDHVSIQRAKDMNIVSGLSRQHVPWLVHTFEKRVKSFH